MAIIYKATSKVTHKCYVGQTTKPLEVRQAEHYNAPPDDLFHAALAKEDFTWEILAWVDDNERIKEEVRWSLKEKAYEPEGLAQKPGYLEQVMKHLDDKTMPIVCVEKKLVFDSLKEAADYAGVGVPAIKTAIKNNTTCGKFDDKIKCHWRYITEEENETLSPQYEEQIQELKLLSSQNNLLYKFRAIQEKQREVDELLADFEQLLEDISNGIRV